MLFVIFGSIVSRRHEVDKRRFQTHVILSAAIIAAAMVDDLADFFVVCCRCKIRGR